MRTPPTNWTTLMAQPHQTETRVDINNVSYYGYDGESGIWSLSTRNALFENFGAGNCHSGQIDLVLVNPQTIPTMAKMEVYVRLTNGTLTTSWVRKGIYYIDTREWDAQHEFLTITGYDAMLKAEQPYYKPPVTITGWPKVDTAVVAEICTRLGVELDTRTVLNKGYMVQLPAVSTDGEGSDSLRTTLGYIGAAYGGNWIITDEGKLLLVPLKSTATAIALGTNGIDLQTFPAYDALGTVHLVVSEEAEYVAGSTGRSIEISCPWGTQTMANNLLTALSGYVYQPLAITTEYAADPLWELGDNITFNGYTSVIADTVQNFSLAYTADISAPNDEEINHEYPFIDKAQQEIKRVVAKTTASLRVDIDRIEGKVDGKITTYRQATVPTGASTGDLWYATADVGSYKAGTWYRYSGSAWEETSETVAIPVAPAWEIGTQHKKGDVVDDGGKWYAAKLNHTASSANKPPNATYWEEKQTISQVTGSQITQMVDGITLSVTSGSSGTKISMQTGGITIDSPLVDMHVKALNIDGKIQADKLELTDSISWADLSETCQQIIEDMSGDPNPSYIHSTYISQTKVISPHIYGGDLYATGAGNSAGSNPAFYMSDGVTGSGGNTQPNSPKGWLCYDKNGEGTATEAAQRVFLHSEPNVAMRIEAGGNLAISSGGFIYLANDLILDAGSIYGTTLPASGQNGRVFFLI